MSDSAAAWLQATMGLFQANFGALAIPLEGPPKYQLVHAYGYETNPFGRRQELAEGVFAGSALRALLADGSPRMVLNHHEDSRTEGGDSFADGLKLRFILMAAFRHADKIGAVRLERFVRHGIYSEAAFEAFVQHVKTSEAALAGWVFGS